MRRAAPLRARVVGSSAVLATLSSSPLQAIEENAGWPVSWGLSAAPAVSDLNRDRYPEVYAGSFAQQPYQLGGWDWTGAPLPGWPRTIEYPMWRGPSSADLDNDGVPELVVNTSVPLDRGIIHAFQYDGQEPAGWPVEVPWYIAQGATLFDLDADGKLEVIFAEARLGGTHHDTSWVHVRDCRGTSVPPWPKKFAGMLLEDDISVGDLDLDGDMELVFAGNIGSAFIPPGWVFAYHHDGTPVGPDSVFAELDDGVIWVPIPLADLHGDPRPELIAGCANHHLHALDHTGAPIPGWPPADIGPLETMPIPFGRADGPIEAVACPSYSGIFTLLRPDGETHRHWPWYGPGIIQSQAVIADLDGDPAPEIFVGGSQPGLWALELDASTVEGWPHELNGNQFTHGVITDLDRDGDTEVIFQDTSGEIHAFDTPGLHTPERIPCPRWMYDRWKTGSYHKDLYREIESFNDTGPFQVVADSTAWGGRALSLAEGPGRVFLRAEMPEWDDYALWLRLRRQGDTGAAAPLVSLNGLVPHADPPIPAPAGWWWVSLGRIRLPEGINEWGIELPAAPLLLDRCLFTTRAGFPIAE